MPYYNHKINKAVLGGITIMAKIVQTAGRNALGEFAPEFAHFNHCTNNDYEPN